MTDFLELFEFSINIFLYFRSLSQQHFPLFDVIDGLIVMSDQVPFNKGTISHIQSLSATLGIFVDIIVS